MKKLNLVLLLIVATTMQLFAQQTNFERKYLQDDNAFHFNDDLKLTRATIFADHRSEFGLGANDEMRAEQTIVREQKFYTRFNQFHKGYKVEHATMNTSGENGVINYANGVVVKDLDVNINSPISEATALQNALTSIGATEYTWQNSIRENNMKEALDNVDYSSYPKGELKIVRKSGTFSSEDKAYSLAWVFSIEATVPSSLNTIYINAIDGAVIYNLNTGNDYSYNNSGTGWTWYNGSFSNLGTGHCGTCTKYRLNSNKNIMTFSSVGSGYGNTYPDNNNNWVENSYYGYDQRKSAHSAHWSVERTWDYYLNHHGRWGSDYNGKQVNVWMRANVPVSSFAVNGANDDVIQLRGDFDYLAEPSSTNAGTGYSVASFDILAHEYTHAMIARSSNLVGYGESGALNEGFADIFSQMAERYTFGTFNWAIGENIGLVRKLDNPNNDYYYGGTNVNVYQSYPSPGKWGENMGVWWITSPYYFPQNPMPSTASDPTVHRNGGVLRHWFYLLANGGTYNGVTITGVGVDKAEDIAYLTFNWYIWSTCHYIDAANGSVQATKDFYGVCSPEHKAVAAAWRAVTGNYPTPLCKKIIIGGPLAIKTADLSTSHPATFTAKLEDETMSVSNVRWTIPSGWNVTTNGLTVALNSTTNTTSQAIKVTYTNGTEVLEDQLFVHFTDEVVVGYNRMPSNKTGNNQAELSTEKFSVYPNPASDLVSITIPTDIKDATYYLYNINSQLLQKGSLYNQFAEINTKNLATGLYILQVKGTDYSEVQKVNIIH